MTDLRGWRTVSQTEGGDDEDEEEEGGEGEANA